MSGRDTSAADNAVTVTPSDSAVIPYPRSIYVGVTGDVKVTMKGGGVVTFKAVPVGVLPVRPVLVWATGTSATDILALY